MDWRRALSDNNSAYVELQAGLFRNQETYGFLEPQDTVRFTEYWLPVRAIGGITRATLDAVFNAQRVDGGSRLSLGVNVTHDLQNARVRVRQDERTLLDAAVTLSPREDWRQTVDGLRGPSPWTFELLDASGHLHWDVPAGAWTILRLGHTSTGQRNETGGAGQGLECDKFNPAAARVQFDQPGSLHIL